MSLTSASSGSFWGFVEIDSTEANKWIIFMFELHEWTVGGKGREAGTRIRS
jgi:hypothetical protein